MNVDELIEVLKGLPADARALPVAVHANGHTYSSVAHRMSHGPLMIATVNPNAGAVHVLIGNMIDYKHPDCSVLHSGRSGQRTGAGDA